VSELSAPRLRHQLGNGSSAAVVAIFAIVVIVVILALAYYGFFGGGHWFGTGPAVNVTVNTTTSTSP
jgi:capsule polysaccharide export protein KpsE/RkpR